MTVRTCHHFLSLLLEHVSVLSHQYDLNTPSSLSEFSIYVKHINNLDSYCNNLRLRAFCKVATVMVKEYSQVPTVYSSIVETKMFCKKSKSDLMAFESDKLSAELQR